MQSEIRKRLEAIVPPTAKFIHRWDIEAYRNGVLDVLEKNATMVDIKSGYTARIMGLETKYENEPCSALLIDIQPIEQAEPVARTEIKHITDQMKDVLARLEKWGMKP